MGKQQDPLFRSGLKSTQSSRVGSGKKGVNILQYRYVSLILIVFLFVPLYAYAGVFSFLSNMFSSNNVSAEQVTENSQNMALLQAPLSPSLDASSTKNDVPIANGTSLLPEPQVSPSNDHTADADQISVYVVHQGDTLPAIAKMFGVTVNTVVWGNDIKGNKITPGQTLVILPISGVQHVVKKGDTLKSIATLHKGDIDEIMQYNNLSKDSKLAVGDIIIVPDGEMGPTVSKPVTTTKTSGSIGTTQTSSYPVYDGYYMRPIIGGVKTQGLHGHNGVDLASSFGSSIMAAAAGTVIVSKNSGWNGGYGSYIVISHNNGTQTLYAHLSATLVSNGDHVEQGQVIGRMGSTGNSSGTHLHFEVRGARNPF